jgi:hypothetical protein
MGAMATRTPADGPVEPPSTNGSGAVTRVEHAPSSWGLGDGAAIPWRQARLAFGQDRDRAAAIRDVAPFLGIRSEQLLRHHRVARLCLVERHSRLQAAQQEQAARAALGERPCALAWQRLERYPRGDAAEDALAAGESLGRHADDCERAAVDSHGAPNDGRIRAEARTP